MERIEDLDGWTVEEVEQHYQERVAELEANHLTSLQRIKVEADAAKQRADGYKEHAKELEAENKRLRKALMDGSPTDLDYQAGH